MKRKSKNPKKCSRSVFKTWMKKLSKQHPGMKFAQKVRTAWKYACNVPKVRPMVRKSRR